MGFLFTRRWLGFLVAVLALTALTIRLGDWQFHRLDERRAKNTETRTNLAAAPVPASDVLKVGRTLDDDQEWRRVSITGTWDDKHTVVIRYQTRDSAPGVDVVTPLVTDDGAAVAIDRGWMATKNTGSTRPDLPAPGSGTVTVTGYTRVDATGGSAVVTDLSARSVSAAAIAKVVPYAVYGGFVMQTGQTPKTTTALGAPQLPELDDGPHFFYGLQWWFFGFLAVAGFLFLAYDEVRQRRTRDDHADEAVENTVLPVSGDPSPSVRG